MNVQVIERLRAIVVTYPNCFESGVPHEVPDIAILDPLRKQMTALSKAWSDHDK